MHGVEIWTDRNKGIKFNKFPPKAFDPWIHEDNGLLFAKWPHIASRFEWNVNKGIEFTGFPLKVSDLRSYKDNRRCFPNGHASLWGLNRTWTRGIELNIFPSKASDPWNHESSWLFACQMAASHLHIKSMISTYHRYSLYKCIKANTTSEADISHQQSPLKEDRRATSCRYKTWKALNTVNTTKHKQHVSYHTYLRVLSVPELCLQRPQNRVWASARRKSSGKN